MPSSKMNLDHVVQTVTDIAVEVSGAEFGAFFINAPDRSGEPRLVHALPNRETFERFRLSRALLDATLCNASLIRVIGHPRPGVFTEAEEIVTGICGWSCRRSFR